MNLRGVRKTVAVASPFALPVLALFVAVLGVFHQDIPNASYIAVGLLFVAAGCLVAQTRTEYIRRNNDSTLILQYQKKWDDAAPTRHHAAAALLDHWDERSQIDKHESDFYPVEDVLDILEDVGFYIEAEQISAAVAHNHLFHWIRTWRLAARPFVEAHQEREPTRWDHLAMLYSETAAVERQRTPKDRRREVEIGPDEDKLKRYVNEERELNTDAAT